MQQRELAGRLLRHILTLFLRLKCHHRCPRGMGRFRKPTILAPPQPSDHQRRPRHGVVLPVGGWLARTLVVGELPPVARKPTITAVGRVGSFCGSTEEVPRWAA
ncbi:hypothetical protein GCM10009608_16170 [Pseudonocardia alaniniphila]